jgi:hypothetical protein
MKDALMQMLLLGHAMASFTIRVFGDDVEQQCSFHLTVAPNKTKRFHPSLTHTTISIDLFASPCSFKLSDC